MWPKAKLEGRVYMYTPSRSTLRSSASSMALAGPAAAPSPDPATLPVGPVTAQSVESPRLCAAGSVVRADAAKTTENEAHTAYLLFD